MQRSGATNIADWFPLRNSVRQASFYDPKTKQFTLIDTCYSTHHLQFDNDPDETVYFNELSGPIFGWIDTKVYDETPQRPTTRQKRTKPWAGAARCSTPTATERSPGRSGTSSRRGAAIAPIFTTRTRVAGLLALDGVVKRQWSRAFRSQSWIRWSATACTAVDSQPGGRLGVGSGREPFPRLCWSGFSAATIPRRAARPSSSRCRHRATIRAAWISTATAWSGRPGRHQPSGQLRRSQVQGLERSGRKPMAASARKAGRSIRPPVPS